jgi:glycine dehydrogenase subunit 1
VSGRPPSGEAPTYLGVVETHPRDAATPTMPSPARRPVDRARSECLAGGLGADIARGDIQSLGMHQLYGGGHAGFIAAR